MVLFWLVFLRIVMGIAKSESEERGAEGKLHSEATYPDKICFFAKAVHNESVQNYCKHPILYRVVTLSGMHHAITHPNSLNLWLQSKFFFSLDAPLAVALRRLAALFPVYCTLTCKFVRPTHSLAEVQHHCRLFVYNCCKVAFKSRCCPGDSVNRVHFSVNFFEKLVDESRICIFYRLLKNKLLEFGANVFLNSSPSQYAEFLRV